MMTPGMAGAATTVFTGTLVQTFGLRGDLTALAISFFLGLLVWADKGVPFLQRFMFYLVNSVTIFAVSTGLNEAGVAATKSPERVQHEQRWAAPEGDTDQFFQSWFR